jgi:ABC-2 type transport system ATP-binding protein
MNLLEFTSIQKRFRGKEILSNVSFAIFSGEIFGLVGRSGCGKSTLLKILIGMVRPDNGKILFEGYDAVRRLNYLRQNTGFATQENMLFDELSIKENSFYFGRLYGLKTRDIKSKFNELLNLMELSGFEDVQINHLSGGMVKRANILVSLIHSPKLLVLDEPTVGLDPLLRSSLWTYIQKINQEGTTILVTSHLLDEIEQNCDRIAVMKRGRIVTLATVKNYKETYSNKPFSDIFQDILKQDQI